MAPTSFSMEYGGLTRNLLASGVKISRYYWRINVVMISERRRQVEDFQKISPFVFPGQIQRLPISSRGPLDHNSALTLLYLIYVFWVSGLSSLSFWLRNPDCQIGIQFSPNLRNQGALLSSQSNVLNAMLGSHKSEAGARYKFHSQSRIFPQSLGFGWGGGWKILTKPRKWFRNFVQYRRKKETKRQEIIEGDPRE